MQTGIFNARAMLLGVALTLAATSGTAQDLPRASPEAAGLSAPQLTRITEWMKEEVAARKFPGAVTMIVRKGKVGYLEVVGQQTPGGPPMSKDSIFRIYSMTKPIVTVAAMMLVEEGRLLLDAPVARYIPAFASAKVIVEKPGANGAPATQELLTPRRAMTVQDLMRHTSGLTYGFFGDSPAKRAYLAAKIGSDGDFNNAEFADRLATMPLGSHPGSAWDYSYSTDILGRVIEVVEGKPLLQVLQDRLFRPLGMKNTSFFVPEPERQKLLAEPFDDDRVIGAGANVLDPRVVRRFESGGGGLVSTAHDYARFLMMLANQGSLDGRRYIGPHTLSYMTSDHLGAAINKGPLYLPGPGYGFGLGFAVRTSAGESAVPGGVGEYNWGGAGGTAFWVDPKIELFVVFMIQSPKNRTPIRAQLRNLVYAALTP